MKNTRPLDGRLYRHVSELIERYPALEAVEDDFVDAYLVMEECFLKGGKLLTAGNGGSAADAEHITGELMKSFCLRRAVKPGFAGKLLMWQLNIATLITDFKAVLLAAARQPQNMAKLLRQLFNCRSNKNGGPSARGVPG